MGQPSRLGSRLPAMTDRDARPTNIVESADMAHTYEELSKMTVAQLREVAKGIDHEAVRGYSTMHKEHLLPAVCEGLGIETHAHHEAVGINKSRIKKQIRELKAERDKALEAHDPVKLKQTRREIRSLKRKIRKAILAGTH